MDPEIILQWMQVIQELLATWQKLQSKSIARLPTVSALPPPFDPFYPTMMPGALRAMASVLFPHLPPELYLDAAVMALDQGSTLGVQSMLNHLGANLKEDGRWLGKTTAAVKKFQVAKGLPAHGWVDYATYAELTFEVVKPPGEHLELGV